MRNDFLISVVEGRSMSSFLTRRERKYAGGDAPVMLRLSADAVNDGRFSADAWDEGTFEDVISSPGADFVKNRFILCSAVLCQLVVAS